MVGIGKSDATSKGGINTAKMGNSIRHALFGRQKIAGVRCKGKRGGAGKQKNTSNNE